MYCASLSSALRFFVLMVIDLVTVAVAAEDMTTTSPSAFATATAVAVFALDFDFDLSFGLAATATAAVEETTTSPLLLLSSFGAEDTAFCFFLADAGASAGAGAGEIIAFSAVLVFFFTAAAFFGRKAAVAITSRDVDVGACALSDDGADATAFFDATGEDELVFAGTITAAGLAIATVLAAATSAVIFVAEVYSADPFRNTLGGIDSSGASHAMTSALSDIRIFSRRFTCSQSASASASASASVTVTLGFENSVRQLSPLLTL